MRVILQWRRRRVRLHHLKETELWKRRRGSQHLLPDIAVSQWPAQGWCLAVAADGCAAMDLMPGERIEKE
eukprot:5110697-Lingulodinium_polyedra.AAC.1